MRRLRASVGAADAGAGVGTGGEALCSDGSAARFARSVGAVGYTGERVVNVAEAQSSVAQQSSHLLALEGNRVALGVVLVVRRHPFRGLHNAVELPDQRLDLG